MVIYNKIKVDIGKILRNLCDQKGVKIIEAEACPDHIHMLLFIPPKYSVAEIMEYLKGKRILMIFDRHANLKYKYGNRSLQVQRILCRYSRKEQEKDSRVHQESAAGRYSVRPDQPV